MNSRSSHGCPLVFALAPVGARQVGSCSVARTERPARAAARSSSPGTAASLPAPPGWACRSPASVRTDAASNAPSPPGAMPISRDSVEIMKLTNTPHAGDEPPSARMSAQIVAVSSRITASWQAQAPMKRRGERERRGSACSSKERPRRRNLKRPRRRASGPAGRPARALKPTVTASASGTKGTATSSTRRVA